MQLHKRQFRTASPATVPMCATHWETLTKTSAGWVCPQCQSASSLH